MTGVLELISGIQYQRKLLGCNKKAPWVSPKVQELQVAKEILAEIFCISISEVDEMLRMRYEAKALSYKDDDGLWPENFSLAE